MSQNKSCAGRKENIIHKNSLKEAPFSTSFPAFYVIEAAVSIPVFVAFMVCILFFFRIMQLQLQVQAALNDTGRTVAEYAVLENAHSDKVNAKTELAAAELLFYKHLKEQKVRMEYIELGSVGIHLLTSKLEGDYIHLKTVYRIKLPIGLFGKHAFTVHQQSKSRKWTGDGDAGGETEVWVYLTPTGKAYHKSCSCPYLDLSIRGVKISTIRQQRNKSGGRYKRCKECGKSVGAIVYVTDYGDVYHGSLGCPGLKRSVQRVRLSEAGNRHACSKCGG